VASLRHELVLCVSLLFAVCALADDTADRVAIGKVIASLDDTGSGPDAKPLSTALFTSDALSASATSRL